MSDPWAWRFRCFLGRTIDGDTVDLFCDKANHDFSLQRIRLVGINTPEDQRPTKEAGAAATAFTQAWMEAAHATALDCVQLTPHLAFRWPLSIVTFKSDSFDRYLATVTNRADPQLTLNDALLAAGHAVVFMA